MNDRLNDDLLRAAYARRPVAESAQHRPECPDPDALLAAARGEGKEAERLDVLDRALRCAVCRRELALLHAVSGTGAETRHAVPRPYTWQRIIPLAAAASVVLLVGVVGIQQWRLRQDAMRAAGTGEPELIAPLGAAAMPRPVTFVWHSVPGALRYTLEVFADDGTLLLSTVTVDTTLAAPLGTAANIPSRWWVRAHMDDGSERRSETRALLLR